MVILVKNKPNIIKDLKQFLTEAEIPKSYYNVPSADIFFGEKQKERLVYSRPGLGSATTSNGSAVSIHNGNNVGAENGGIPTSDTMSVPNASVAQRTENVKDKSDSGKGTKETTQKAEQSAQENTNKGSKWDYGNKQEALNDLLAAMGLK